MSKNCYKRGKRGFIGPMGPPGNSIQTANPTAQIKLKTITSTYLVSNYRPLELPSDAFYFLSNNDFLSKIYWEERINNGFTVGLLNHSPDEDLCTVHVTLNFSVNKPNRLIGFILIPLPFSKNVINNYAVKDADEINYRVKTYGENDPVIFSFTEVINVKFDTLIALYAVDMTKEDEDVTIITFYNYNMNAVLSRNREIK